MGIVLLLNLIFFSPAKKALACKSNFCEILLEFGDTCPSNMILLGIAKLMEPIRMSQIWGCRRSAKLVF